MITMTLRPFVWINGQRQHGEPADAIQWKQERPIPPDIVQWAGSNRFFSVNVASMKAIGDDYTADYYEVDPPVIIGAL
jgi:hypothetical protein